MAEEASQAADSADTSARRKGGNGRRKWYLIGLALLFVAIGVVYGVYYLLVGQYYAETKDAYVEGNTIQLAPQRPGTVIAIHAQNTDLVHAGDTVVELDHTEVNNRLDQTSAALGAAVRQVHQLFARAREQRAIIDRRETELAQARRDYKRNQRLLDAHGVTRKAFEHSRAAYHQAQSALDAAQAKLAELAAQIDGTSLRKHPQVQQAAADVRAAYLAVRRSEVPAPVTGYIAKRHVQLGEKVDPSEPMLSIVPLDHVWVDANFKETDLAAMRIGQPVHVTADLYGDDVVYHGHVAGLSAGTGAAFELLPPQNATGNWIKIVRRVPVRIALDPDEVHDHPLRLGLSMDVTVDLHDTRGKRLARTPPVKTPLKTNVYTQRTDGARRLIQGVIDANDGDPSTPAATGDGDTTLGRLSLPQ